MRNRKKISLLIIALLCFCTLWAQKASFINFTVDNGLPQSQVLSICQTKNGEIWLGTNNGGIAIYNGRDFRIIDESQGLAGNIVYNIQQMSNGNMLICTQNGISIYDGHHFHNFNKKDGLPNNLVFCAYKTDSNTYWIGTKSGVCIMKDTTFIPFHKFHWLNKAYVFNIYKDNHNNLWFSTLSNGLFRYNGKTMKIFTKKDGLLYNKFVYNVRTINDTLWVMGYEAIYKLYDDSLHIIKALSGKKHCFFYNAIQEDKNTVWIASSNGAIRYRNGQIKIFDEKSGMVNNDIWNILKDREDNLWFISKANGVSQLSSLRFLTYSTHAVLSIALGEDEIWIGTQNGLKIINPKQTDTSNSSFKQLDGHSIYCMKFDPHHNLWMGTDTGIIEYANNQLKRYGNIIEKNNTSRSFYAVFTDSNYVLFTTQQGVFEIKNGKITPFLPDILSKIIVFDIYKSKNNTFWFATEKGLIKYNNNSTYYFTKKDGIPKGRIRNITSDKSGNLYFGTNNGIYIFDGKKFKNISTKDGLPSNIIYSLAIDSAGNLWAGLPQSIAKITCTKPGQYKIRNYTDADGFLGQECFLNALKTVGDKIYIGTLNGLVVYQPQYDYFNTKMPLTRILSVKLFSQKTNWLEHAGKVTKEGIPENLTLSYDENYLTINYIGVSLKKPKKVQYKYKLKGLDKDWQGPTQKTQINYSSLKPGNYTFLVIADNGNGIWNKKPASFSFQIKPPFWETWWFYGICILILLGGVYYTILIRAANKKITKQNKIIEEKNDDITASIVYAKRIQEAILPDVHNLLEVFSEAFILYKPRDIVSGDFFWINKNAENISFAVADCTGHGVPGAFMSMMGNSLLNQIIRDQKMSLPNKALDAVDEKLTQSLNQSYNENHTRDGMDIALCHFDKTKMKLFYAGANNPVYILRENNDKIINEGIETKPSKTEGNYHLFEIKATKQPIGGYADKKPFESHSIQLQKGDCIYIFSDGFADQFGGPNDKKFMYGRFKNLLLTVQSQPLSEQKETLDKTIADWMGDKAQVDDICVLGVRL